MRRSHGHFGRSGMFGRLFGDEGGHEMRGPGRHGRGGHGRGHHGGRDEEHFGRILGHGDLRYVVLALLEEKPRHGYEIIKDLEEKSSGQYTPSPGVVYPTLTFLEESGYASVSEENKKKLYSITAEGKVLLDANREFVENILSRLLRMGEKMSKLRDWFGKESFEDTKEKDGKHSIRKSMHLIKVELFSMIDASAEQKKQVAEILERTAEEIRKVKG